MDVKELLKERRVALGLSMKELAERVGVSEGTISRWESGDIENMRRDKIAALSEVLGIPPVTLLGIETPWRILDDEAERRENEFKERPELKVLHDVGRKLTTEDLNRFIEIMSKIADNDYEE